MTEVSGFHCLQTFSLQYVNQFINGNLHISLQMW